MNALCVVWASYQIRKLAGCACAENAGNVFPGHRLQRKPLVSDPDMHHGTCVTHVPWCMSVSLNRGRGEKRSRHSRRMRNPQFYVSGKRPMDNPVPHCIPITRSFAPFKWWLDSTRLANKMFEVIHRRNLNLFPWIKVWGNGDSPLN